MAAQNGPSAGFWELIALLEAAPQEDSLAPLTVALRRGGAGAIRAFGADMALALAVIGTDDHMRQHVGDVDDPDDVPYLAMSDDVFLYARCSVIASGRLVWQHVADDPSTLARRWDLDAGENLLQLVYDLHDDVVGEEWSPDGLGHVHEGWLEWRGGYDVGVPSPEMHRWAQDHLVQALDEDPAWQRWWAHSGRPQLRVDHLYTPEPKRRVKVRRGEHRVTIDIERACTPLHTNERKVLWREAEAEVRAVLEIVAAKYRMPPMPTCPVLPSEPDLTGWEEAEDDDTSPWSEEVEDLLAEQGVAPELIAHLKADAEEADRESFEAHRRAGCFGG